MDDFSVLAAAIFNVILFIHLPLILFYSSATSKDKQLLDLEDYMKYMDNHLGVSVSSRCVYTVQYGQSVYITEATCETYGQACVCANIPLMSVRMCCCFFTYLFPLFCLKFFSSVLFVFFFSPFFLSLAL